MLHLHKVQLEELFFFLLPSHIIASKIWKWKVKPLLLIVHFAFLDFRFVYINAGNEIKKFLF